MADLQPVSPAAMLCELRRHLDALNHPCARPSDPVDAAHLAAAVALGDTLWNALPAKARHEALTQIMRRAAA